VQTLAGAEEAELAAATFLPSSSLASGRQARRGEARSGGEWDVVQLKMGMGGSILWQGGHPGGKGGNAHHTNGCALMLALCDD
jgi:hypothetical protein